LSADSLKRADACNSYNPNSILIGQCRSSAEERITYGGYLKYDSHPFHFEQIYAVNDLMQVDTFNGNVVIIPKTVSDMVGRIDGVFAHAYADIDYGLRAKRLGVEMLVIPGFLGICDENPRIELKRLRDEIRHLVGTKSLPIKSQIRFLRRHGNLTWPIYLLGPFIKIIFRFSVRFLRLSKHRKEI
jgi:GT2 family glycosyltransferase